MRLLVCLTVLVAVLVGASPAAASEPANRRSVHGRIPVEGVPGEKGIMRASLLVSSRWTGVRQAAGALTARMVMGSCTYSITVRVRLTASLAPLAEAHVAARMADAGGKVLDEGRRGIGAWRVVHVGEHRVQALWSKRSSAFPDVEGGVHQELFADARPNGAGCRGGRRAAVARHIGDGLAVARSQSLRNLQ